MKKLIIVVALSVSPFVCGFSQTNAELSGHLSDVKSGAIVIQVADKSMRGFESSDTVKLDNGNFSFSAPVQEMRIVRVSELPIGNSGSESIDLALFPGMKGTVTGSFDDFKLDGNKFFKDLDAAYSEINPVKGSWKKQNDAIAKQIEEGGDRDSLIMELKTLQEKYLPQLNAAVLNFIKNNPDSNASAMMLTNLGSNHDEALALLSPSVKTGPMTPIVDALTSMLSAMKAREEAAKNVSLGKEAFDFTLTDINGNPFTLSSLRGKYVMLDFWGSWCGWCLKGVPAMKECYEKHKDKMEIVGIDCNDTEEKWKACVKKFQMPWLHVYNTPENDMTVKYAVSGFPTKIIVNPEGVIEKVVTGEDPDFYNYLDSLFGSN